MNDVNLSRPLRSFFFFCTAFFVLNGCAVRHGGELMRLKAAAASSADQENYVKRTNQAFEKLLKATADGTIDQYRNAEDFRRAFGEPIFTKDFTKYRDVDFAQLWLYRYCEKFWGSEKVYLYFDSTGNLVRWEHRPAKSF